MSAGPISITVRYQSVSYPLTFSQGDTVDSIFSCLREVVDLEGMQCVLVLNGKKYVPGTDSTMDLLSFIPRLSAMLISVPLVEIEKVKRFKSDPLVKGFAEQERDDLRRIQRTQQLENENPWGAKSEQHKEYRFSNFEILYRRAEPPPFAAEKLLRKLAIDPGIVHIMTTRSYTVGCLCEIDPRDTDEEHGSKDECLLGWNRNAGQRIALRLRTDDLKSFRNYNSIVNTLIHELTHNVFGPHDAKFWKLFNELKHEYTEIHRARGFTNMNSSGVSARDGMVAGRAGLGSESNSIATNAEQVREARIRALNKPI
jgi:hypothetical protein